MGQGKLVELNELCQSVVVTMPKRLSVFQFCIICTGSNSVPQTSKNQTGTCNQNCCVATR